MKDFDLEKLERQNIYRMPDHLFTEIQQKVVNDVKSKKEAPVFKLKWALSAAASVALIFGVASIYNADSNSGTEKQSSTAHTLTVNKTADKNKSEAAYEILTSDLVSAENIRKIADHQEASTVRSYHGSTDRKKNIPQKIKTVSEKTENQMAEYLDSFTNSEIADLANNSSQDVYLDLYN